MHNHTDFRPRGQRGRTSERMIMTIDEFEALRLIDHAEMTQEECAARMQVARTTAQKIYNTAKKKVAVMFVEGKNIRIEGGEYELCQGCAQGRRCHGCQAK